MLGEKIGLDYEWKVICACISATWNNEKKMMTIKKRTKVGKNI